MTFTEKVTSSPRHTTEDERAMTTDTELLRNQSQYLACKFITAEERARIDQAYDQICDVLSLEANRCGRSLVQVRLAWHACKIAVAAGRLSG